MQKSIIVIGCDNAAVEMRDAIEAYVRSLGYAVEVTGVSDRRETTVYPVIAEQVCRKIQESGFEKLGILICGTGIGMAISANKCAGIRAAVCHDSYSAERAKLSNNTNVLCMGARVIGIELAKKITKEWLSLTFVDGNSTIKIKAISELEEKNFMNCTA